MHTQSPTVPVVRDFTASLAAAAKRIPAVTRAEGYDSQRGYGVRYAVGNGSLIELAATPTASEAVARFIKNATADAQRSQFSPTVARPSDATEMLLENYMPPLPSSANELIPEAPAHYVLFALDGGRYEQEAATNAPRLAVCEPVTREQWGHIERGTIIIYTNIYRDEDPKEPLRALFTEVGRFIKYDAKRGGFYATLWHEDISEFEADADDMQEVYRVVQFLNVAPQPTARA